MLENALIGKKKKATQNLLMHFEDAADPGNLKNEYEPTNFTLVGSSSAADATKKFGARSRFFNKGLLHLNIPIVLLGDYTFDCWVYVSKAPLPGYSFVMASKSHPDNAQHWAMSIASKGNNQFGIGINLPDLNVVGNPGTLFGLAQWTHIASVRQGNKYMLFANGVLAASYVGLVGQVTIDHLFGWFERVMEYSFQGFVDEVRILDGVAAYTANFTPPTSPYSI